MRRGSAAAYFLFLNLLLTVSCRIRVWYIMFDTSLCFCSAGEFGAGASGEEGGAFSDAERFFKPSIAFNKFKIANFSKNNTPFSLFFVKINANLLLKNLVWYIINNA